MAVAQRSKGALSERLPGAFAADLLLSKPEERGDLLAAIESEIIPRLMLAHRADPVSRPLCTGSRPPPSAGEVFDFARTAACHDLNGALATVESLCRAGLSLEDILLDLVAPAARLLGDQWLSDLRSFTEVSAGLGTLQQLVHILGPSFAPGVAHRGLVVLVAAPGEQHTLGLYLVGEFLRRAGWGVQIDPAMPAGELTDLVASEQVEMVGFSVSNTELLAPLSRLISAVRGASRNPALAVMVGGSLELAEYAAHNGVALHATDPRDAVRWLERRASVGPCIS